MDDIDFSAGAGARCFPRLSALFRLQWEEAQQAWVLLYPEGMVKLNASAGEILRRCDGSRNVDGVIAELEAAFAATGLAPDVHAFLEHAARQRWVALERKRS